jgi:hypothetical protein
MITDDKVKYVVKRRLYSVVVEMGIWHQEGKHQEGKVWE